MKLIPSYIDDTSPPGEKLVFSSLQNSNYDWIALHSLDLSPFNNDRRTEIDFVIIMPKYGIFCIEVKSQRNIYFDGNQWQPTSLKKSPFKQALDARFAFHRRLETHFKAKYTHIPVLHCCIFPLSHFQLEPNISIHECEVIDKLIFDSCKTADDFCNRLIKMFLKGIQIDPAISKLQNPLSNEVTQDLVEFCYPIRKRKPENFIEIQKRHSDLESKLLQQQKPVLDLVNYNDRVLVQGGAGTGKSLIGIEIAKRKAEQGLRVACLCFNKIIGKWLESQFITFNQPNLIAGTVHSVLLRLTEVVIPSAANPTWWEEDAIDLIEEKLTAPDFTLVTAFDYIVIDEAQDILARPKLWNCLQLFIEGGLKTGNFLILGDFINQSLTINNNNIEEELNALKHNTTRWFLNENCRNYKDIGKVSLTLSNINSNTWLGFMRSGGSVDDWSIYSYVNDLEQLTQLKNLIQLSRNNGYKNNEITLLSFRSLEKSIFKNLTQSGVVIEKASELDSKNIIYSTINSYKGMENKVIIITDIVLSPQHQDLDRKLFYTGMTRATEKLYLLCKNSTAKILSEWVYREATKK